MPTRDQQRAFNVLAAAAPHITHTRSSASAAMSKRHGGCSDCPEQPATRSEGRRLLSLKLRALTDSCIPESVPGRGYLSVCHCDWGYPLPDFESGQLPITIELRNLGAT